MTNPSSIVARIYKSKYYSTGDLLDAELGHHPSFIWRSLWNTKPLLSRGLRWKIGDGRNINVWTDPWLKDDDNLRVETPINPTWSHLKVADLFIPYTTKWNEPLLTSIFLDRDTRAVMSLPPPNSSGEDRRIWHYSINGQYTVKSPYRVYMDHIIDRSEYFSPGEWCQLWHMNLPAKLLHFAWRVVSKVLPTRGRLRRRGVKIGGVCGLCGREYEEDWHLFIECTWTRSGWEHLGINDTIQNSAASMLETEDWFWHIIRNQQPDISAKVIAGMWGTWRERNTRVWSQKSQPSSIVMDRSWEVVQDWRRCRNNNEHDTARPIPKQCSKWHPPPILQLKCNVDIATFEIQQKTGFGMVIRDSQGSIMHYRMQTRAGILPAKEAEAVGLLEAIRWIIELQLL
ncbi:Putative ribonuclease H protein At1g65750 [Linum grandiflorum]